jgi:hypothetical protein
MWKTQREQTLSEGNDAAEKDSRKRRTPRDFVVLQDNPFPLLPLAAQPLFWLGFSRQLSSSRDMVAHHIKNTELGSTLDRWHCYTYTLRQGMVIWRFNGLML